MSKFIKLNTDITMFDTKVTHRCCNCISISLYYTNDYLRKLVLYLSTIKRTIQNVEKNLPQWIVRLYIDSSVYHKVSTYSENKINGINDMNHVSELLNYILAQKNVEVYTFFCDKIISNDIHIAKTRTFRFLPLIENDVNVCIIREADGFVTNLDCHNIKQFANSDKIFYLPSIVEDYYNEIPKRFHAYSQ